MIRIGPKPLHACLKEEREQSTGNNTAVEASSQKAGMISFHNNASTISGCVHITCSDSMITNLLQFVHRVDAS